MAPLLTIRAAGPADDDALWSILEPVFRAGDTYAIEPDIGREAALSYWTGGPARAFLAEEGAALGTFSLRPNARGGGAHVANAGFVTAAPARRRGVARAMLRRAELEACKAGFAAMQFNFVVATHASALHIWRTEGYAVVGRLPGAFRHPSEGRIDALVMFKSLEGPA